MTSKRREKPFLKAITSKLILTIVLAAAAIVATVSLMKYSFSEVLSSVEELADPNEKLRALNQFYIEVSNLERQQQVQILENASIEMSEMSAVSDSLLQEVDNLKNLGWSSQEQYDRMDSIKSIIAFRMGLLMDYQTIRSMYSGHNSLNKHLDSLISIVQSESITFDTSVVTTEHRRITRTPVERKVKEEEEPEDKRGFFQRLFGGGKNDEDENENQVVKPKPEVLEETTVVVDTLSVEKRDSVLASATAIISQLEREQKYIASAVRKSELELVNTSSLLFTQLLEILNEVENEELMYLNEETTTLASLINGSAGKIYAILIVFVLLAALIFYLIISDVTQANYYKKQLVAERDRANELSEIKERFLANMSHEIRTPLQSILGYSEQLLNQKQDHKEIEIIHHSSEHLLHIVNEVLDYSRISAGKYELSKSNFNLGECIQKTVDNIRIQAREKGVKILFEDNTAGLQVHADPFRLNQILYNLLGNAIKFTSEGFVMIKASPGKLADGKIALKMEIEDTGIGMSREELEKVFNQFEQANADISQSFGGTGLGLSIVKALVELHNGEINLSSEPGQGTKVEVSLFLEEAQGVEQQSHKKGENKNCHSFKRLLIIDDDSSILKLCGLILRKTDLEFESTTDWEKGLELLKSTPFDVALLDLRMPTISGYELVKKIKAISPDICCIAFTAHVFQDRQKEVLESGFDDVLSKPFTQDQLLEKLDIEKPESKIANGSSVHPFEKALQSVTLGDEELKEQIAGQFLSDTRKELCEMAKSVEEEDLEKVHQSVHRLSGKLGMFGGVQLSPRFRMLEEKLLNKEGKREILNECRDLIEATEAYCKEVDELTVKS